MTTKFKHKAWVPEKERSEIGSLVFGGVQIGVCSGYFLTGLILKYLSWEWVFYIWGIVELIWFGLFVSSMERTTFKIELQLIFCRHIFAIMTLHPIHRYQTKSVATSSHKLVTLNAIKNYRQHHGKTYSQIFQ